MRCIVCGQLTDPRHYAALLCHLITIIKLNFMLCLFSYAEKMISYQIFWLRSIKVDKTLSSVEFIVSQLTSNVTEMIRDRYFICWEDCEACGVLTFYWQCPYLSWWHQWHLPWSHGHHLTFHCLVTNDTVVCCQCCLLLFLYKCSNVVVSVCGHMATRALPGHSVSPLILANVTCEDQFEIQS